MLVTWLVLESANHWWTVEAIFASIGMFIGYWIGKLNAYRTLYDT